MITPVLHRLLIKPKDLVEANDTYKKMKELGLALPEHNDTKKEARAVEIGTVIALGETAYRDYGATEIPVIGDTIYFAKYSGKDVRDVDGVDYLLVNDEDVVAIIKE